MKITFSINYRTRWGESLYISAPIPQLGDGDVHKAAQMNLVANETWELTINIPDNAVADFDYRYIVKADNAPWRQEWGNTPHRFKAPQSATRVRIFDSWQDMPADKPYYSSAFVNGILMRKCTDQPLKSMAGTLRIEIAAPMVAPDEVLAMAGSDNALGNWNPAQALRLNDSDYPVWTANIPLDSISSPFEYKFLIINKKSGDVRGWEMLDNRVFNLAPTHSKDEQIVISGLRFANPVNNWRGAGTAIPVFSIRTAEDFGVGDFVDIKKMVDWCRMTGQNVLQLLPVNDTTMTGTWVDSYPYKANSTFALHPMYLRPQAAGRLKDASRRKYFEEQAADLNKLPQIDYEKVNNLKTAYMRELFAEQKSRLSSNADFIRFTTDNAVWLKPYCAWSVLRDINGTPDNTLWGQHAEYNVEAVDKFCHENASEIAFYEFVQYHLDRQLRDARDYAHLNGVVLKGDIPIGISRHSVDAWLNPRLFNMDCQAGAPPDDFSVLGQNWGFPTYNWEEMAKDGFAWWKARFAKMSEYFDAYRIDHILGFFRIWQIPLNAVHGLLGYFNPAMPFSPEELRHNYDFWINPATQTHPYIHEWMLGDFFGDLTAEAKERFLEHEADDRYRLRQFADTQQKVEQYFSQLEKSDKNTRLQNALYGLLDDVLFIEDPYQKGHYHPRIAAQYTYQYRALSDYEKWCFDRLYNDFFYRRHNDFWYGKAMWKLPPLLDSTAMLACGEDLGMIPDCVPAVMNRLEILSLEIQRMPKDPKTEFGNTWAYPYYSVCTTSTHDMPGIRGWWEADHSVAQRYYNDVLHEGGEAPYFAEPWVCSKIVDLQLASPSMLCVLPLQDWLSIDGVMRRKDPRDEQINEPSNPRHYWRYRMHITVEKLMEARAFNEVVTDCIARNGR